MYKARIFELTKQLYPKGRAFKFAIDSAIESLTKSFAKAESKAFSDAVSILNNILPDNSGFLIDDVRAWESKLGLISNESVSIEDRKQAIARKLNFPGTQKARQSAKYLQNQLQLAGFNVFVHENKFSDGFGGFIAKDPIQVATEIYNGLGQMGTFQMGDVQMGDGSSIVESLFTGPDFQMGDVQMGDAQMGGGLAGSFKVANHIDETLDNSFEIGDNLQSLFFVGGSLAGTFASVPLSRKKEFRQLILKIKPVQSAGFLFINFT